MVNQSKVVPEAIKVLVVDDDEINRMILEGMLEEQGFAVLTAEDGEQAVNTYEAQRPDIVLMDIMMPKMNGYEATQAIKKLEKDSFVPVIFLTAVTNEDDLAKCVKSGGDDFLTKPYSQVILFAKIEAFTRMREYYNTIVRQRDQLDYHNTHMLREQEVAKRIFNNIVHTGQLDKPFINYLISPLSIFNGDMLLAAETGKGGLNIMVGDATGHGLPAAIGAIPVSDIFYELSESGVDLIHIINAINEKLKKILPAEFFFCACLIHLDENNESMEIWMGGLPEVIRYNPAAGTEATTIRSMGFPLGIVDNNTLAAEPIKLQINGGDRFFIYSDGVIEAANGADEMFGKERLLACVEKAGDKSIIDTTLADLAEFKAGQSQSDDTTMLELTFHNSRG
jgi:CheY-like chemotaxis protein